LQYGFYFELDTAHTRSSWAAESGALQAYLTQHNLVSPDFCDVYRFRSGAYVGAEDNVHLLPAKACHFRADGSRSTLEASPACVLARRPFF
jgi:hypothetical protein